ncbi:MAG: hypothetical protein Fur0010_12670 [Bdellovibrio sp.]
MRILIVDDDDSIRDYLIVVFENLLDTLDIVECANAPEALKLLSADPYFQLIVSDFDMPGGNGDELYFGIKERKLEIPFLLHTSHDLQELKSLSQVTTKDIAFFHIQKGVPLATFEKKIKTLPVFKQKAAVQNYNRIRLYFFLRFSKSLCDVYIKINEQKYLKFIHKDDVFDNERIKKMIQKNVQYLYITKADFDEFAVSLAQQPFLTHDNSRSVEDRLKSTQMMLQHMAMTTGISKSVLSLAERNIELVMMEAEDIDRLSELLRELKSREDYGHDHAYLLCYFCCVLCDAMGWQTRRSREKLCFAALFHDIVLKDADLAMVENLTDKRLTNFSPEEIKLYKTHPADSAKLLHELAESYPQIDQIVEQHHEWPDGSGFPRGLKAAQIQPLPSLFILCHAFVSEMYRLEFDQSKYPKMLARLKKQFNTGHFQKLFEKLEEILTKKAKKS